MSERVVRMEMPKICYNCDLRYECNAFYAQRNPKPFMKGCRIVCQLPEWPRDDLMKARENMLTVLSAMEGTGPETTDKEAALAMARTILETIDFIVRRTWGL